MRKMKKKNINLFEQYEKAMGKGERKKLSKKTSGLLGAAGFLAVLTGVYLILFFQTRSVQNQYDELYSQVYSPDAAEQTVNVTQLEYENQVLTLITNKYISNMSDIEKKNKETGILSADLIGNILSCRGEDTWVKNISYDQGIVFINGEARDAVNASGFVSELDRKGIFSYVSYTGYSRQGNVYAFSATGYFDTESDSSGKSSAEGTGDDE